MQDKNIMLAVPKKGLMNSGLLQMHGTEIKG